jgi:hypothetical protein
LNGIQYIGTFGAGYATTNGIQEAIIANTTPGTNGSEPASGQILAHALLNPGTINKGANDVLVVTWNITFTGA